MTQEAGPVHEGFLPQSVMGRAFLFVLSIGALPFSGVFLFILAVGPAGQTWGEWLLRLGMAEFFSALFASGCVGVAWAVATPNWLPIVALRVGQRMAICLFIPWAIMLGLALWPL